MAGSSGLHDGRTDLRTPVLVYDGDCAFCSRYVRWLQRGRHPIRVTSFQESWPQLDEIGLTIDDVQRSAWWLDGEAKASGASAISSALIAVGGVRAAAGRLIGSRLLKPVSERVYAVVARNRHQLARNSSCSIQQP